MIELFKKLLLFSPLLLILILVNFFVDPSGVFSQVENEDRWVAEKLKAGLNVIYDTSINDRMVQSSYIKSIGEEKKDLTIVVIGSSRALQINNSVFLEKSFFNSSLTGATLEDILAITELYLKNNVNVETVILGVDPWMFNRNNGMEKWRILEVEYNGFLADNFGFGLFDKIALHIRQIKSEKEKIKKYGGTLVSLKYFQHSLQEKKFDYESTKHQTTENIYIQMPVKLPDGSLVNSESMRSATEEQVRGGVIEYLAHADVYGMESFNQIDPILRSQFGALLASLNKKKINVILFLPPFHPLTYDYLKNHERYKSVVGVEDYLCKIADELGIRLLGSYDPARVGLTGVDFYDFMHPKREAVENLFLEN